MKRLEDFKFVISNWMTHKIPYVMERYIKLPADTSMIVSVTGPRRAGKTFLLYDTILKLEKFVPVENILYINFEHERLRNLDANDLSDIIVAYYEVSRNNKEFPVYLFLDEIQTVKDWHKWINRIYESKNFRIYISGSSSKLLSRELSTELRGRSVDYLLLPLSFQEFLMFNKIQVDTDNINFLIYNEKHGELNKFLMEYIKYGGFPEVILNPDLRDKILISYIQTIIIKDVGERFKIEPSVLSNFFDYAINLYSKYISGGKIYNYLKTLNYKISREFPLNLIEYFKEVFALFEVEINSRSFKSGKQSPRKLYIVDSGIIYMKNSKLEYGRLMENCIFLELYRRSVATTKFKINYWKEYGKSDGKEVDFVLKYMDGSRELINVTYAMSHDDIKPRGIDSLFKAEKDLGISRLTVITWDYFEKGKINFIPLWYWLVNYKY